MGLILEASTCSLVRPDYLEVASHIHPLEVQSSLLGSFHPCRQHLANQREAPGAGTDLSPDLSL
jgi:hypothetical protein